MLNTTLNFLCSCCSNQYYIDCCQPYHQKKAIASTPEILMRSRYTAFVLKLDDYLLATHHPSTRPVTLDLNNDPYWSSLRIIESSQKLTTGQVHFQAIYKLNLGWGYLEEKSQFIFEDGHWYYLSGKPKESILRPARNETCPCGSGIKFKHCCLI